MKLATMAGCAVLAGAVFGCAAKAPQAGPEAVAAIQGASDSLQSAYMRGDAEALAGLLTEDVVVSPIAMQDLHGRESIRALFSGLFNTMTVSKYHFHVSEVEIYGNVAYDRGEFEWESVSEGQSPVTSHGRYSAVRRRGSDGVWRLHRLIENELPTSP